MPYAGGKGIMLLETKVGMEMYSGKIYVCGWELMIRLSYFMGDNPHMRKWRLMI